MFEGFGAFGEMFQPPTTPRISVDRLPTARYSYWHGEKYPGGLGAVPFLIEDYWALRQRSAHLFKTNLYARGLIRRLVTNEINDGLHLEATPEASLLEPTEEALAEWAEEVEKRFILWGKDPRLCDHKELASFGALQATARMEALVAGDVLVVLRQDRRTGLPRVQLISGSAVQTPLGDRSRRANRIVEGVELDPSGRQVGYWITQRDGTSKSLPAYGEKSGRRIAWLLYGTDKRLDDVRGEPLLSLVVQSMREIDRYRDSTQRKAVINSMLAMFIEKTEEKMGTRPLTGGAVRRGTDSLIDDSGAERTFRVTEHIPGLVLDELQHGEVPRAFPANGTDEKFADFEAAIIHAVAWANEVPPEILQLAFSNNYSASQAAINEFKIYLNKVRTSFGEGFCQPVYVDWLLSQALSQRVQAPGLLEAWRDPLLYDVWGSWVSADWAGHIKPSTDIFKQARGYKMLLDEGLITRDRAARELTGTKYSQNAKKLRRENELLTEALEPVKALEPAPTAPPGQPDDEEDVEPGEGSGEDTDEEREAG